MIIRTDNFLPLPNSQECIVEIIFFFEQIVNSYFTEVRKLINNFTRVFPDKTASTLTQEKM